MLRLNSIFVEVIVKPQVAKLRQFDKLIIINRLRMNIIKFKLIFGLFGVFILSSCHNNLEFENYETGELKKKIYYNNEKDTTEIISFSKKGEINSHKYFQNENNIILKSNQLKNPYYSNSIEIFKDNKFHGILKYFKVNDKSSGQSTLFLNGIALGGTYIEIQENLNYNKYFVRNLSDTFAIREGLLVYNKNDEIIEEESFGYIVISPDTVEEGEAFTYELEFFNGKFAMDSVLYGIYLGTLDTNRVLVDTINPDGDGGWIKKCRLKVENPQVGYNLITGEINALGLKGGFLRYNKNMLFYHDFYVKPKEE